MPGRDVEKPRSLRSLLARSPEMHEASRQLAWLALARVKQDGLLRVRQREQLRRALATAGDALDWTVRAASRGDAAIVELTGDVSKMAKSGAKSVARDLADELAKKRTEMTGLQESAASARKLAEDPDTTYPVELTYSYTARNVAQELVTKTETVTANDAKEANDAANAMERNFVGRGKLADLMIADLQQKQGELDVMTRTLSEFLESSHDLLREVLATLQ